MLLCVECGFRLAKHCGVMASGSYLTKSTAYRLDDVLMDFGHLYRLFSSMNDPNDEPLHRGLIQALEKIWDECDKDLFMASILLNPLYNFNPICEPTALAVNRLQWNVEKGVELLSTLWVRCFGLPTPDHMQDDLEHYLTRGSSTLYECIDDIAAAAESEAKEKVSKQS